MVKVDQRIRWHYSQYTITILRFRIGAWQHEVSKLYGMLPLSAGMLIASAGTPYRLTSAGPLLFLGRYHPVATGGRGR